MSQDYKVTLASRSMQALEEMSAALAATPNLACRTRHLGDGQFGTLLETKPAPDLLVLHFEPGRFTELTALAELGSREPAARHRRWPRRQRRSGAACRAQWRA